MYFDKTGKKISFQKWSDLQKDDCYRIVKVEYIGRYFISTVWLGDYFETMVFDRSVDGMRKWLHVYADRYSTLEESVKGHDKAVEMANNGSFEE